MLSARVAKAFDTAAPTYDAAASAQRQAGDWLLAGITARAPQRVADIGCGTGAMLPALRQRFPLATLLAVDTAPAMLREAGRRCPPAKLVLADAQHLPCQQLDLLCSNLTLQWLPPDTLRHWQSCLRPDGELIVTTLGENTFAEWRAACAAVGIPCGVPVYPTRIDWQRRFPAFIIEEYHFSVPYPSAWAFLMALKQLGAHTPTDAYPCQTGGALRRATRWLDAQGGLRVTYHLIRIKGGA